jgi:V8-like Glu-specific endopeptidase
MRWITRLARSTGRRVRVLAILATAFAYGSVLLIPASEAVGAGTAAVSGDHIGLVRTQWATMSRTGHAFGGVPAVGALFTVSDGKPTKHFCTAGVVHSAHGDLAVTAAHCVTGAQGQIVFMPGYANGKEPYGAWPVTAVYTNQAWQSTQDPDDDVAFLRLADEKGMPVEGVTGAERLGINWPMPVLVQVIGYPDDTDQPFRCANLAKRLSRTQLEFDCGGYPQGTSGGPFLADVSGSSGQGTVIGVIGGYEQGGDTPEVSYAPAFGTAVSALYQRAQAAG